MGEIIPSEPRPRLVSLSCATGSGHRLRGATSSCRRLIVTASYRPSDCPPGVPPTTGECIVGGVSASLVHSATTQAQALDDGIHDAIRQVWMARGADREPTVQQWAEYDAEAKSFNATTSIFRPGFINGSTADPRDTLQERVLYRAHWLVARTAEHIGGWARRPLPLPDMCYAAAATGELPHLRDVIVKALVSVEEDLHYEAPR